MDFDDVVAFQRKFGVPMASAPAELDGRAFEFRFRFLHEELAELRQAHMDGDLAKQADALVDLVYVALGTAAMMGLPWRDLWDEVHHANMRKERATGANDGRSVRGHEYDVVKPEGWTPPDVFGVLTRSPKPRPTVVCLCGSTRFKRAFLEANYRLTARGVVVLTVGWFSHEDDDGARPPTKNEILALDELHKRKIDMCDEVFVLNVGGYIGESTRSEIAYAHRLGKPVAYLEPVT